MARGYYRRTKSGKRVWVRASGSLPASPQRNRAAGKFERAINYWNNLPDNVRFKRMAKNEDKRRGGPFGVPLSAKKLKRRGLIVFEDGSIARR